MKKQIFILLFSFGISQLGAETLLQIYPPSLLQFVSGKYAIYNTFREDTLETITDDTFSKESGYTMFNLPIEIRKTIASFSFADLMITSGSSFYFENNALSSINMSLGLTFGYGYNKDKEYLFGNKLNTTIYLLYEYPFFAFKGTPKFPWKFALDINLELLRLGPISINVYVRAVYFFTNENVSGLIVYPDIGLITGWVF
jgi:hypothetical protein